MKNVILILSVCLNLLAAGYWLKVRTAAPPPEPPVDTPASDLRAAPPEPIPSSPSKPGPAVSSPAQEFDWRMVESEDYRQYIENLRAIGCPEETIRDIIVADVKKLFDARKKAMRAASTNQFEFWKSDNMFGNMLDEDKIREKQEMAQERKDLLKALLGTDVDEKPDMAALVNPFEDMLDFLPEDKQAKIMELMQTYQAKAMKSMKGGAPDTEDMKAMQNVQKEMEAEMARILTPDELEDYQLRLSQTAMMMRMQLSSFDPNEQEFRDIFKLRKDFDDEHGMLAMFGAGDAKAKEAQKDLNEQIKQVLGEQRYADYERAQDFAYQGIAKVVERQGLPRESAIQVYDMKKAAEEEVRRLRADQAISAEQRQAALQAIRAETESAISQVIGPEGLQSYQSQPTAFWLKNISPDPQQD